MSESGRLRYVPGLDGLRAVAVVAVFLYHAGASWLPGGFLGVEVFFVLSGYLITSLLIGEWDRDGRIDLRAFWTRRALRLLPAVALLLAVLLAFVSLHSQTDLAATREGAAAAAGYATNWYLIFHHQSYFESLGRPPLLQHLWSLAIEEQFYVAWPLAFGLLWRFLGRRGSLAAILVGGGASAALMAYLAHPGSDPSRVYYGTDTRAAGLLAGAALACLVQGRSAFSSRGWRRWMPDVMFIAGAAGLAVGFAAMSETNSHLYRGGFLAVDLATVLVIAGVVLAGARGGPLLLGNAVLGWLGKRSYGIYLWHWPIVVLTGRGTDVPIDGFALFVVRVAATVGIAALSYRFVEWPVRHGAIERAWRRARAGPRPRRRWLGFGWAATAAGALGLALSVAGAEAPPPPDYLPSGSVHLHFEAPPPAPTGFPSVLTTPAETTGLGWPPETVSVPETTVEAPTESPATALPTAAPEAPAPTPRPRVAPRPHGAVLAVGESVMLGAANELGRTLGSVDIDASTGRQVRQTIDLLEEYAAAGALPDTVVVQAGDNGRFSAGDFDRMMEVLAGVQRVVFVNLHADRDWIAGNNAVIAAGVGRYPNAVLVDWAGATAETPDLFWDGMHVRPAGAELYADLILEAVAPPAKAAPPSPTPTPSPSPKAEATSTVAPSPTPTGSTTATGTTTPTASPTTTVTPTASPATTGTATITPTGTPVTATPSPTP